MIAGGRQEKKTGRERIYCLFRPTDRKQGEKEYLGRPKKEELHFIPFQPKQPKRA